MLFETILKYNQLRNPKGGLEMAKKKIKIDSSLCMGCGACAGTYPDDIRIGDAGTAEPVHGDADEEAVSICPFGAISVEE